MKLLLMQPTLSLRDYTLGNRPPMYEPLGLGYLAAAAREAGHKPVVVDCVAEDWENQVMDSGLVRIGMSDDAIEARIREIQPEFIGLTCMFTGFDRDVKRIAAIAKKVNPNVPIAVGGADATSNAKTLVEDPNIDMVLRSEGEKTLVEILRHMENTGEVPMDQPGTTVKGHENSNADSILDLDTIPLPARDLLPMETYHADQTPLMPYAKRTPIGFMVSSRGCPYNCIFCSTVKVWGRWRGRSAENVVDEMEDLVKNHGVREIAFQDDSFLAKQKRVIQICDEIRKRKLDITWTVPPGLTVWTVNEKILKTMQDSGFYRACFPVESGDPEMLKYIRKPINLDQVLETIDTCHRLGIWTYGNFIIGFPEQSPESVEKTAEYAVKSGLDMINVYVAQPYAGSDLYDIYDHLGMLDQMGVDASTVFNTQYDTKYFKAEELRQKRAEIYDRFTKQRIRRLFTPQGVKQIGMKMRTPENLAYGMRVFGTFAKMSLKQRRLGIAF